ncbi:condensation domain-containing protein [Streptacidiphilus sp. N1-12]|uniref:Condensation domain-containing protein n=2 Tax=Streptacidiphilus alkalitolerans TaxID=3342712 RepID=A0ABV6VE21_9ACTN
MLRCIAADEPAHINMHVVWELPAGIGPGRVADLLAALRLRHESLRTTFPVGPEPRQLVHAESETALRVYAAQGDPALFAEELGLRWRAVRFDPAVEHPVRAALVTDEGRPAHLVLVLSHAAVDATSLGLLRREWLALLAGEPLPAPAATRPVDLAHLERSPEGERRAAASLRYWAGQLATIPQAMFAVPPTPAAAGPVGGVSPAARAGWTPRLRIRSQAAAAALDVLTERTGVSRSSLVLTALSALTAHRTGHRQAVVTTLSANRYLPELTDYVGTVAQDALFTLPVGADDGFEALARRVRKRTQLAYPHSWFDSEELWTTIDRVGCERGTRYARDCVFNDLSPLGLDGGVLRGGADPRDPAQQIQLSRLPDEPLAVDLMLWVFRLDGELDLSLWANPARLAAPDAELFGRGLAVLLIEAARGDVKLQEIEELTGLPPVARGPRWLRSDGCWIDGAEVDELLAHVLTQVLARPGAAGPPPFLVVAEPDERLGHRLVCHLAAGAADPARIHTACVAALPGRPAAMAPHHYVLHTGSPADPADPAAWRALPVRCEGNGRTAASA